MIYRKAGTTNKQCILVRVMPGNPKSPNVTQKKPYVVHRKGEKAISKNGSFIPWDDPNAHIPLEDFKFTKW